MNRIAKDRDWKDYPIGTKAHAFNGGYWIKVPNGWKWCSGSTFPSPGADAIGNCVELPATSTVNFNDLIKPSYNINKNTLEYD